MESRIGLFLDVGANTMNNEQKILAILKETLAAGNTTKSMPPNLSSIITDEIAVARSQILFRFWDVYHLFIQQQIGVNDFLILLRQLIRTYGSVAIHLRIWQQIVEKVSDFGIAGRDLGNETIETSAFDWTSSWLDDASNIDRFENRILDEKIIGDGLIASMEGNWITYRSAAQKIAVDSWLFASEGTTTLVSLPTGSGKSLCTILPAWYESRGGAIAKGTTIVIVPTVALAYDQQKQAQRFFPQSRGDLFEPLTRTGATSQEERKDIEQAILDGTLPILYTSPESLLQSNLYYTCLKAAKRGLITRFVIDEAHLIEIWGADFRPEFQLLSTYRRLLLQASGGKLKTLLLSATITPKGFDTLAHLFSEQNRLITIQANQLRNEIEYYFNFSQRESTRRNRVLEALRYLPRPAILYVTQPEQAEEWINILHREGYSRIDAFHGKTPSSRRYELIQEWSADKIDIMVATSAFGLGVDKRHVRTVIHATLPENLDRLYQEVGRGGRDGCRAISLVCIAEDDHSIALSLTPKRITVEKAYPRWRAMIDDAKNHPNVNDVILVNRDATRKNEPTMRPGPTNQEWNFRMLLMMQRAGMLEIAEVPPISSDDEQEINWLPIRILKPEIYNNKKSFETAFEVFRTSEIESIKQSVQNTFQLIAGYVKKKSGDIENPLNSCLALKIGRTYERSQLACSGCPTCRNIPLSERPYLPQPIEFQIDYPDDLATEIKSQQILDQTGSIQQKMSGWNQFTLTWKGDLDVRTLSNHLGDIAGIIWRGFEQIIYPEFLFEDNKSIHTFIKALSKVDTGRNEFLHRVIPARWLVNLNVPILPLNTLVIYPTNPSLVQALYERIVDAKTDNIYLPSTLNIVHIDQRFKDGRKFIDVVDGLNEPIEWFVQVEEEQEDDFTLF
ncbi:MAG: ATP-dependent DNA helicase RecQ [Anaerolineales bacterium]|nr:ATP-dependent DNA helicase RecQ [Anaerolineales bacterium]